MADSLHGVMSDMSSLAPMMHPRQTGGVRRVVLVKKWTPGVELIGMSSEAQSGGMISRLANIKGFEV